MAFDVADAGDHPLGVTPRPRLPDESRRIDSVPPSVKAMVSAAGKNMPVLVSPELVMEGADAEPSANSMVCAPLFTTTVPLVLGSVMVAVTASVAWIVVWPDVAPLITKGMVCVPLFYCV